MSDFYVVSSPRGELESNMFTSNQKIHIVWNRLSQIPGLVSGSVANYLKIKNQFHPFPSGSNGRVAEM